MLLAVLAALSCNLPTSVTSIASTPTTVPPPATSTPIPRPLELTHHPLYWFAPLPPQPGGPYDGSDDYMELFKPGAPWDQAASYLQVFKLYGGWVARDSSDAQLKAAMNAIRQHGLGLAVEVGPLNSTNDCGLYIEGFAGEEGVRTVKRVKNLGGVLNFIGFDEPYDIRAVRFLPGQFPAGATVHRVRGKGPGTGASFIDLHIFDGQTEDSKWLEFTPPSPWLAIEVIRIESVSSPSWIAWREIEILR